MDHHSVIRLAMINRLLQVDTVFSTQTFTIFGILFFFLLIISFVVSGAEVAFFSLTYKDLNMLKTRQNNNARQVANLLERPKHLLASLLIANCLANITIILIVNYLIDQWEGLYQIPVLSFFLKVLVVTVLLVFLGEILPKVGATQNNIRFALTVAPIVSILYNLFQPVSELFVSISDGIEKRLSRKNATHANLEEIDAIELTVDQSTSQEEKNMLKGIVKFSNITVKQIMRTRLDVSGIDYNESFTILKQQIADLHYSRLPVYKENLDNIVGILYTKDLLIHIGEGDEYDWHEVLRQPYFVPEQKLIEDLLKEFQTKHIHFAVVVDEFGGTSGIVTLEDIMEEIIGDIRDEFDDEEFHYHKIDENNYVFEGKTMLNDVCRIMNIPSDTFEKVKGESDSLGGLILELAGAFPEVNSVISYANYDFTVLDISKMRIQKIKVTIRPEVVEFD